MKKLNTESTENTEDNLTTENTEYTEKKVLSLGYLLVLGEWLFFLIPNALVGNVI